MPGRAARGYRERHLAKECFGSNRVSKERLQLPAATTTETNPKGRKTVIRKNAHYQKKPPTTPCATTAQHPKENHFSLDKLFQECPLEALTFFSRTIREDICKPTSIHNLPIS